jgi:hypothetical protein
MKKGLFLWTGACFAFALGSVLSPGQTPASSRASSAVNSPPTVASNATQTATIRGFQVALKPTAVAPSSASGVAALETGAPAGKLSIEITSLGPGHYDVYAKRKSDGSSAFLGRFTIADPTRAPDVQANDNKHQNSTAHVAEVLNTRIQLQLSSDLAPSDIAQISVSDSGGNAVLRGDNN